MQNWNKVKNLSVSFLFAAGALCFYAAVTGSDPIGIYKDPDELTCDDVKCVDVNAEPPNACAEIKCALGREDMTIEIAPSAPAAPKKSRPNQTRYTHEA